MHSVSLAVELMNKLTLNELIKTHKKESLSETYVNVTKFFTGAP